MTRHRTACLFLLLLTCLTAGCSRKIVAADNPAPLDTDLYKTYFDTTVRVLRDNGYVIDRNDYRFGTITTLPQGSPTVFEVWNPQNTTGYQAVESTLADEQRRVAVTFTRPEPDAADQHAAPSDPGDPGYAIEVEVILERRQVPTRYMTGSARRNVFSTLSAVPKDLADKGVTGNYWLPIGRDAYLEARLMKQINERVAAE